MISTRWLFFNVYSVSVPNISYKMLFLGKGGQSETGRWDKFVRSEIEIKFCSYLFGWVFLLDFVRASRGVGVNNFCCGLKQIHGFEGYVSNHPRNYGRLAVPSLPDALLCLNVLNPWRYFMKFQS